MDYKGISQNLYLGQPDPWFQVVMRKPEELEKAWMKSDLNLTAQAIDLAQRGGSWTQERMGPT